ncbi:MAG: VanZ family protein [Armatimonadota bacterium]
MVVWLCLLFVLSSDRFSDASTGTWLGWLLDQVRPGWHLRHPHAFALLHWLARKTAHFVEYALLAAMLWRAVATTSGRTEQAYAWSLGICALYGAADELHQAFVPSRGPSGWDVCIDTAGAAFGLLVVAVLRWATHARGRAEDTAVAAAD